MIVRNPNLALQHSKLEAAIDDIRKEPSKPVVPPKPRGRPTGATYPVSAPNSAPPLKKVKKVS